MKPVRMVIRTRSSRSRSRRRRRRAAKTRTRTGTRRPTPAGTFPLQFFRLVDAAEEENREQDNSVPIPMQLPVQKNRYRKLSINGHPPLPPPAVGPDPGQGDTEWDCDAFTLTLPIAWLDRLGLINYRPTTLLVPKQLKENKPKKGAEVKWMLVANAPFCLHVEGHLRDHLRRAFEKFQCRLNWAEGVKLALPAAALSAMVRGLAKCSRRLESTAFWFPLGVRR